MHEMGLMQALLDTVRGSAEQHGITRVKKIRLVVGEMTMAQPHSLQFAFGVLSQEPLFQGAVLEIEARPLVATCKECGGSFSPGRDYCFICPGCQGQGVEITSGRELFVDYYEGDAE
ncbi:MAG: hydrogenase maturation nickel metallochaperone HypA [Syntrophomonadaceae bacterium]|jgi:hydrogenase nickel incorporation protein HypA/HybF|nr:hydrogenase maturation nickel metallochaperone HypA [Syntrophomonadaceae bacterium]MDH7497569.1 hydrogenase maturation nickel metallochaperone HypA [Syntrophomonadaceae bacterium]